MLVIKLGGAAVTAKQQFETLNEGAIAACLEHIATWHALHGRTASLVVCHGAGSFGHLTAARSNLKHGGMGLAHPETLAAFAETRLSVTKLNHEIVSRLVGLGVPAVGVSPCGTWTTQDGMLARDCARGVQELLEAGLVPVVHGDAVFDHGLGVSILSGDAIVTALCERLQPHRAVYMASSPPPAPFSCFLQAVSFLLCSPYFHLFR
jgi:isopentenyl phosphate kinase